MSVMKTICFQLEDDADDAEFRQANELVQAGFTYQQPGIIRRTAAKDDGGQWLVVEIWDSPESEQSSFQSWQSSPIADAYLGFINSDSIAVRQYDTLD